MNVNIEFLDDDVIENVITSMNFQLDKTIFFGEEDVIDRQRDKTRKFLKKHCGVKQVEFVGVSSTDLNKCIQTVRRHVLAEVEAGNQVYFDVVGGEGLAMLAFGMLANELQAPIHMYDIEQDRLVEYDVQKGNSLSSCVPRRKVKLNVKNYIEMQGGMVNMRLHKSIKDENDQEFQQQVKALWKVVKKYSEYWNPLSSFMRMLDTDERLRVSESVNSVMYILRAHNNSIKTAAKLKEMLCALEDAKVIRGLQFANGVCKFTYTSEQMKEVIWDGGSIYELYVYFAEKEKADDCAIGVHLDWDGLIHGNASEDVLNEIDILKIEGNIPTFISCKSGKMPQKETLYALYELATVAERFGGKYAKKILVTAKELSSTNMERAEEMGIEVKQI